MLAARSVEIDSLFGRRAAETGPCLFVILCQPRTLSSLLNTSLRQHPEIYLHREILNHRQPHDLPDEGTQRRHVALARETHRAVGCNLHAFQPDRGWVGWPKWETAWRALADDRDIKVVHLQRLDTLAQMASWKIASLLGRWGNQHDAVRIDPEELRWFRGWNRAVFEWRLSRLTKQCTEVAPSIGIAIGLVDLPLRSHTGQSGVDGQAGQGSVALKLNRCNH